MPLRGRRCHAFDAAIADASPCHHDDRCLLPLFMLPRYFYDTRLRLLLSLRHMPLRHAAMLLICFHMPLLIRRYTPYYAYYYCCHYADTLRVAVIDDATSVCLRLFTPRHMLAIAIVFMMFYKRR